MINFEEIRERNARANASMAETGVAFSSHPATGLPMLSQRDAAGWLGIEPRRLREIGPPVAKNDGRGFETYYFWHILVELMTQRAIRAQNRTGSAAAWAFLTGCTLSGSELDEVAPNVQRLHVGIDALFAAGEINETGRDTAHLLVSELLSVLSTHSPEPLN